MSLAVAGCPPSLELVISSARLSSHTVALLANSAGLQKAYLNYFAAFAAFAAFVALFGGTISAANGVAIGSITAILFL
jgi:hypothetical protein